MVKPCKSLEVLVGEAVFPGHAHMQAHLHAHRTYDQESDGSALLLAPYAAGSNYPRYLAISMDNKVNRRFFVFPLQG